MEINFGDIKSKLKDWEFGPNIERADVGRKSRSSNIIKFGVRFLDSVFEGIMPSDIILCGAKTGVGKSELVSNIAVSALEQGKRVGMLALEAEEDEVTNRILYREFAKAYYSLPLENRKTFNYVDWELGKFDEVLKEHTAEIVDKVKSKFKNLAIRYKKESYTMQMMQDELALLHPEVDLIILDHVHYIDLNDVNENKALTELIQSIRRIGLVTKKPIIVVAHVRKSDTKHRSAVPDIEDFHGSSNLSKICTKAFMLAPAFDQEIANPTLYPTYLRVCKFRKDGSRARYTALLNFDIARNKYEDSFELGELVVDKSNLVFKGLLDIKKIPYWASGASTVKIDLESKVIKEKEGTK